MEFNATFIAAFVSFVVFIIIMNQILYKPINDIVQKRQDLINENNNEANENIAKKEELFAERLEKIKQAHFQAKEKMEKALQDVKNKTNKQLTAAKDEAKNKIETNIQDGISQSKNAKEVLKMEVVNLAQIISDKFIQTPQKIEADYELIEKIMQG